MYLNWIEKYLREAMTNEYQCKQAAYFPALTQARCKLRRFIEPQNFARKKEGGKGLRNKCLHTREMENNQHRKP